VLTNVHFFNFTFALEVVMQSVLRALCVLSVLAVGGAIVSLPVSAAEGTAKGKVFELRIYKANPGKLDAVNARFRDHTCRLFAKHGIEIVGFWTPATGEESKDTLYYIVAFPSVEAQKAAWAAFKDDPEWKKAKADSETEGVLVQKVTSMNMNPTDYSPLK
jgi:hypothetical protein